MPSKCTAGSSETNIETDTALDGLHGPTRFLPVHPPLQSSSSAAPRCAVSRSKDDSVLSGLCVVLPRSQFSGPQVTSVAANNCLARPTRTYLVFVVSLLCQRDAGEELLVVSCPNKVRTGCASHCPQRLVGAYFEQDKVGHGKYTSSGRIVHRRYFFVCAHSETLKPRTR